MTPTKTREVKYVGKREVERLFGAIPPKEVRDALLFDVIYRYGLRREEATLLRVEHVRERVRVTRVKHGISRDYPIFPRTRRLLWTYLSRRGKDDNPYLFASSQVEGAPISTSLVYQLFHRYAEAAGLPVDRRHPHVLRHSIAVHLLNAGWDLVDVQHWLGHASITSTLIYAQVSNYRINKQFRALRSSQIAAL